MATRIQVRRDTLADWQAQNPTLNDGEPAWVSDRRVSIVGPGSFNTLWDEAQAIPDRAEAAATSAAASAAAAAGVSTFGIPSSVAALTDASPHNRNAANVLQPFYLALTNWRNAPCDIVVMGDSITEGYGNTVFDAAWRVQFTAALRRRVGQTVGGRGSIGLFQTNSISPGAPIWPVVLSGQTDFGSDQYGIKRYVRGLNTTGVATFALNGTSADIVYPTDSGFGVFSYAVDGGAATQVNQSGPAADGVRTRVTLGAAGPHSLVIRGVSGSPYVEGVIEYNGDETSGVRVHDGGHGGYRSDQWSTGGIDGVSKWPAAYKAMNADLLVIALGVNDVAQGKPVADYRTNMTSLLSTMRAVYSGPIVLLAYAAVQNQDAAWPTYVQAMYDLAAADGNAIVCDLTLRLPRYSNAALRAQSWFDSNHPTDAGHATIGAMFASFLSPS